MIIITADDYGKNMHATDRILTCFSHKRVTCAAAMVFMEDSERAATLALKNNLEVGLHLNFTEQFISRDVPLNIHNRQGNVASYLKKERISRVIFNPFLRESIEYLFQVQLEEFTRLFKRSPDFINGHHHVHLCANVLASRLIPKGLRIRRTFTFNKGEKSFLNRVYRYILNLWISKNYITTDSFFALDWENNCSSLLDIFKRTESENVEIVVHPENSIEFTLLLSDQFKSPLGSVQLSSFKDLG